MKESNKSEGKVATAETTEKETEVATDTTGAETTEVKLAPPKEEAEKINPLKEGLAKVVSDN